MLAEITSASLPLPAAPPRELGRITGRRPGPTLVVIGGIHGNEPSGPAAFARVLAALAGREELLRGEIVGLAGNRRALGQGVRYVDRDLNRAWTAERVQLLLARGGREGAKSEDREQLELWAALEEVFERAGGPAFILDLHSTSGAGAPFVVLADTLQNRAFAAHLPAPVVLGLEEQLEGTLLHYLSDLGHVTVGFEGGQHDSPRTIDHAETAIWIALETAGLLAKGAVPRPARLGSLLRSAAKGLPAAVEVKYRHAIVEADQFRMDPGFTNFQAVEENQILAHDVRGPVLCPLTGLILMPLYQRLGSDGFFLVTGFNPVWLKVSAWLRRLRADSIVHWLPGVRRHPERLATYLVDRRVARWYALEIFHLLGFRKVSETATELAVARRPHDLARDHAPRASRPR